MLKSNKDCMEYQGKVAVITGAASGIGKAIAEKCVNLGMKVVLADIDELKLVELADILQQLGAQVLAIKIDISIQADIKTLAAATLDTFGSKIHFLFNNAGIPGSMGPLWELDESEFKKVL